MKKVTRISELEEKYQEIMIKMFDVVGADAEMIDLSEKEWYYKHTWTITEEGKFMRWLSKYAVKNKLCSKVGGDKFAQSWVLNFGWRTVG